MVLYFASVKLQLVEIHFELFQQGRNEVPRELPTVAKLQLILIRFPIPDTKRSPFENVEELTSRKGTVRPSPVIVHEVPSQRREGEARHD